LKKSLRAIERAFGEIEGQFLGLAVRVGVSGRTTGRSVVRRPEERGVYWWPTGVNAVVRF
jgi:hypothetical protein